MENAVRPKVWTVGRQKEEAHVWKLDAKLSEQGAPATSTAIAAIVLEVAELKGVPLPVFSFFLVVPKRVPKANRCRACQIEAW